MGVLPYEEVRGCANYNGGFILLKMSIKVCHNPITLLILQKMPIKKGHFAEIATMRVGIFRVLKQTSRVKSEHHSQRVSTQSTRVE